MPTSNPVPSSDVADLKFNAEKIDEIISSPALSYFDRLGTQRLTMAGAIAKLGFEPPVAHAAGLTIVRATQTVTSAGLTYHADPAKVPFTTTGAFDATKWLLVSNVTYQDLGSNGALKGASLIGLQDAAGFYAATNVEDALAEVPALINNALKKSGALFLRMATSLTAGSAVLFDSADLNDRGYWNSSTKAILLPSGFHDITVNVALGNASGALIAAQIEMSIGGARRCIANLDVPAGGNRVAQLKYSGLGGGLLQVTSTTAFAVGGLTVVGQGSGGTYSTCTTLGVITLPTP